MAERDGRGTRHQEELGHTRRKGRSRILILSSCANKSCSCLCPRTAHAFSLALLLLLPGGDIVFPHCCCQGGGSYFLPTSWPTLDTGPTTGLTNRFTLLHLPLPIFSHLLGDLGHRSWDATHVRPVVQLIQGREDAGERSRVGVLDQQGDLEQGKKGYRGEERERVRGRGR